MFPSLHLGLSVEFACGISSLSSLSFQFSATKPAEMASPLGIVPRHLGGKANFITAISRGQYI